MCAHLHYICPTMTFMKGKRMTYMAGTLLLLSIHACRSGNESKTKFSALDLSPADTSYFRVLRPAEKERYAAAVERAFDKLLGPSFSGEILVAKNGQIVFERYQGTYNARTGELLAPNSSLHLASISKTFTGMTILHLWEQKKLSLDDSIQKFFPAFPYHGITVKMLLSHRSGLPNYLDFLDKNWNRKIKASNQDVITYMETYKPPILAYPGRTFHYCNTNFLMLASILEKITHRTFPQYMKDSVFTPLGMHDSYVFEPKDTANYILTYNGRNPYPMDHTDLTYGDKNIYSTVRDLLLWDRCLYMNTFIKAPTLAMALQPQSNERKSMHNYGMAWRMLFPATGDSIIYHNGKWHGSNTVLTRLIHDTATIIVLGNKLNKRIYGAKMMASIFTGKPDYGRMIDPMSGEMPDENEGASRANNHGPNGYKYR